MNAPPVYNFDLLPANKEALSSSAPPETLNSLDTGDHDSTNTRTTSLLTSGLAVAIHSPHSPSSPLGSPLRIHTDIPVDVKQSANQLSASTDTSDMSGTTNPEGSKRRPRSPLPNTSFARHPSVNRARAVTSNSFLQSPTTPSALSSPMLDALTDLTPLPSPIGLGESPGPWRRMSMSSRNHSRESMRGGESVLVTASGEFIATAIANHQKRKSYAGLGPAAVDAQIANNQIVFDGVPNHARNRSISDYVPEGLQVPKPRNIAVSTSGKPDVAEAADSHLRREEKYVSQKGSKTPIAPSSLPTPPASTREGSDSDSSLTQDGPITAAVRKRRVEYFDATTLKDGKRRRWRAIRKLGEGSFSKVMLATSQSTPEEYSIDEEGAYLTEPETSTSADVLDPKRLVAVKVIEQGPAGGADEDRVESSLKRELDILKTMHHPSLVNLKAFSVERTRALLVMTYCPGGDLFEVASQHHDALSPPLIRRIFAELVGATRYLHEMMIAHRDIKLENVVLNLTYDQLTHISDWQTYPYPVITLTDLGLSKRFTRENPIMQTRCGSEDYASPELMMGQPYDGRQIDAWALGVLLYAIMEGRLPFDPLPTVRDYEKARARTAHRIARCEWSWVIYEESDGEDGEMKLAKVIVEGLLKRATRRFQLGKVAEMEWVTGGITIEGGIKFREEDLGQDF